MPGQTVQAQIRLLLEEQSDQGLHCHSFCIVWTHYSMVEPHSSNFKVITTNISYVRIFRKFTVPTFSVSLVKCFHDFFFVLNSVIDFLQ